ncbi:MAG: hypothetical protein LRZ88_01400 [Candidatus Cloacimonetes bacterium]|nr:hypothetical protein [Candidatus Cloacimonadota bacterium]
MASKKPRKLITGESTPKMEEFHYFRSNISWFPDGRHIAFVAKTSTGDRIHILDVDREKITRSISLPQMASIFEIDVAPDGQSMLLSAQKGMQADIFLLNLDSEEVRALTNDSYNDMQARFSPDGTKVIFASERDEAEGSSRYGFFANLTSDIFELNLESGEILQITRESFDCTMPFYTDGGKKIVFLSHRDDIANLEIIDTRDRAACPSHQGDLRGLQRGHFG